MTLQAEINCSSMHSFFISYTVKLHKCVPNISKIWSTEFSGVFLKWNKNSVNSGTLIIHRSMNWGQFKESVSHLCLVGAVVASWSLTQGVRF